MTSDHFNFVPLCPGIEVKLDAPVRLLGHLGNPVAMGTPFLAVVARKTMPLLEGQSAVLLFKDGLTIEVVGADPRVVRAVAEQTMAEDQWIEWITCMAKSLCHDDLHLLSDPAGAPLTVIGVEQDEAG